MAEIGGNEAKARRLKLAEEADKGADEAAGAAVELQRQAGRWAEHEEVAGLVGSLDRACRVLTGLTRAEQDLAAALVSVALRAGPDRAAQLRLLADEARADARRAEDRASSLRELAVSVLSSDHQRCGSA
jgi:hypothetical protein